MKRHYLVGFIGLLSLLPLSSRAEESSSTDYLKGKKIVLARYAKAYVGQGNVTVLIAPFKSEGKDGAILLFKGIESPWDGQAILHTVQPAPQEGKGYVATYKGKSWESLREGPHQNELYVPEVNGGIELAPSDGASQLTHPREIFQTYLDQNKLKNRKGN